MQQIQPLTFTIPKPSEEANNVVLIDNVLSQQEKEFLSSLIEKSDFQKTEKARQQEWEATEEKLKKSQKLTKLLSNVGMAAMFLALPAVLLDLFAGIPYLFVIGFALMPAGFFTYAISKMDGSERQKGFETTKALLSIPSLEHKTTLVKKMAQLMGNASVHQDIKDELQKLFTRLQGKEGVLRQWLELSRLFDEIQEYYNNKQTLEVFGSAS